MFKAFVDILEMIMRSICDILIQLFLILQDYHLSDEEIIGYVFGVSSIIISGLVLVTRLLRKHHF